MNVPIPRSYVPLSTPLRCCLLSLACGQRPTILLAFVDHIIAHFRQSTPGSLSEQAVCCLLSLAYRQQLDSKDQDPVSTQGNSLTGSAQNRQCTHKRSCLPSLACRQQLDSKDLLALVDRRTIARHWQSTEKGVACHHWLAGNRWTPRTSWP
jgi:hypothetical protein